MLCSIQIERNITHLKKIIEEDKDDYKRPDFSEWKCKICNDLIEEGYSWYYLRHEGDEINLLLYVRKNV